MAATESIYESEGAAARALGAGLAALRGTARPRLARLMGYYRNPTTDLSDYLPTRATSVGVRPYRQYQEIGLPSRVTGFRCRDGGAAVLTGALDAVRREVVIENDIGWRLHTLVDFVVGQMPVITSTAGDAATRARLTAAIRALVDASGGVSLLQEIVLHGAIHGSAYVMLRGEGEALRLAAVPATRVAPVFADGATPGSGAEVEACAVTREDAPAARPGERVGWLGRVSDWVRAAVGAPAGEPAPAAEDVWDAARVRRVVGGRAVAEAPNPYGFVPVVGYVNQPDPAGAAVPGLGLSDVEPLIPLQDELNTRLSDRANRVTMQSFRMYLAKGIEEFTKRPVGPGQMWATDNPDAEISSFGGDAAAPSEEAHINEVREALDKVSGVSPVAAGLLRGKVGNLTSAVALRVTLIALLARTERKRASLGAALAAAVRLALGALDAAGVVRSAPGDRGVEVNWPSAIPENLAEKLAEARLKVDLGVPRSVVLAELGYDAVEQHARDTQGDTRGTAEHTTGAATGDAAGGPGPAGGARGGAGGGGRAGAGDPGEGEYAGDGGVPASPAGVT